jgi:hypothetical protein
VPSDTIAAPASAMIVSPALSAPALFDILLSCFPFGVPVQSPGFAADVQSEWQKTAHGYMP